VPALAPAVFITMARRDLDYDPDAADQRAREQRTIREEAKKAAQQNRDNEVKRTLELGNAEINPIRLARHCKAYRKATGITQTELATRLNLPGYLCVSNIENPNGSHRLSKDIHL
jgi:hypothetical protein